MGIEYGNHMEVLKIQTTESKEVVNYWLDQWGTSKADGMKQVRVN